jgi:hypothetical protein
MFQNSFGELALGGGKERWVRQDYPIPQTLAALRPRIFSRSSSEKKVLLGIAGWGTLVVATAFSR